MSFLTLVTCYIPHFSPFISLSLSLPYYHRPNRTTCDHDSRDGNDILSLLPSVAPSSYSRRPRSDSNLARILSTSSANECERGKMGVDTITMEAVKVPDFPTVPTMEDDGRNVFACSTNEASGTSIVGANNSKCSNNYSSRNCGSSTSSKNGSCGDDNLHLSSETIMNISRVDGVFTGVDPIPTNRRFALHGTVAREEERLRAAGRRVIARLSIPPLGFMLSSKIEFPPP